MSEARDEAANETNIVPPDGSVTETSGPDSTAPTTGLDTSSVAPTLDLNPGDRGPVGPETMVGPSPSVEDTLNVSLLGMGETLEASSSVGLKTASGGCTTDAGSGAMNMFADSAADATTDEGSSVPGHARST